jgi:hypothetical protein
MIRGVVALSVVSFLAWLERAFLDWGFVPEMHGLLSPAAIAAATLFYTVLAAAWLAAIVRVREGRRGALLANAALNGLFAFGLGIGTLLSFCPSPCATVWPLMEIANWSNLVLGFASAIASLVAFAAQRRTALA